MKNESGSNRGSIKKQGRRHAQTWGRAAKPEGKRRANKGTRRVKPDHKRWEGGTD